MIFVPCDLEIWQMTLENNTAPLLSHIKLTWDKKSQILTRIESFETVTLVSIN